MSKKGFTLIELLAVIVVLAVIALITVPILLNIVEKAKIGSAKNSVLGYIDAVEKQAVFNQLDRSREVITEGEYTLSELTNKGVKIKGKVKDAIILISNGRGIISGRFCINNYSIKYENNKVEKVDEDYCNGITSNRIYKKAENLVFPDKEVIVNSTNPQTIVQDACTGDNRYTYMGGCYLKGVQNNNYVWYNGFMWRIMGINQDGSVRLITEDNVAAINWGEEGNTYVPEYNTRTGYINDWLNKYFYSHLNSTKSIIQDGTWCLKGSGSRFGAGTDCTSGTIFSAKIGMITLDEYNLSGASRTNNAYYLINGQRYWTLTPYSPFHDWEIFYNGSVEYYDINGTASGIRPVINVKTDATVTVGDGTTSNPYMLEQVNNDVTNKTLNQMVTSGEYLKLSNKTYRVVSKETQGIKLILDGYYESSPGTPKLVKFNETNSSIFAESTIDTLLNGSVLTWLNSNKIVNANWDQGNKISQYGPYTSLLEDSGTSITRKVGLIRSGEILSSQSSTILTKNYTLTSSYLNATTYWIMTSHTDDTKHWCAISGGNNYNNDITQVLAVRPVIYVSGTNLIKKGSGAWNNPYIID